MPPPHHHHHHHQVLRQLDVYTREWQAMYSTRLEYEEAERKAEDERIQVGGEAS